LSEGEEKEKPNVRPEYTFCKKFRRWAKRALTIPPNNEPEECPYRTKLLEELWDFTSELYVWGTAQIMVHVIQSLYEGDDEDAAKLLNKLADDELDTLRSSSDETEEKGEEEGTSDSE
jgi:hypothetical protein